MMRMVGVVYGWCGKGDKGEWGWGKLLIARDEGVDCLHLNVYPAPIIYTYIYIYYYIPDD